MKFYNEADGDTKHCKIGRKTQNGGGPFSASIIIVIVDRVLTYQIFH